MCNAIQQILLHLLHDNVCVCVFASIKISSIQKTKNKTVYAYYTDHERRVSSRTPVVKTCQLRLYDNNNNRYSTKCILLRFIVFDSRRARIEKQRDNLCALPSTLLLVITNDNLLNADCLNVIIKR